LDCIFPLLILGEVYKSFLDSVLVALMDNGFRQFSYLFKFANKNKKERVKRIKIALSIDLLLKSLKFKSHV
jgi:hypothetical protein